MKPNKSKIADAVQNTAAKDDERGPAKGGNCELVTLMLKDEKGVERPVEKSLNRDVLAVIKSGMTLSSKLENHWKNNADKIILEFFGEDPFSGMTQSDMMTEFRASDEIGVMYAVFQRQHPDMARAERNKEKAKDAAAGSDDQKDARDAYDKAIRTIRATAMNQAIKVCRYYAEAHSADKPSEEREQETALSLIEATIRDYSTRVEKKRGNFNLKAEQDVLNGAIDLLREYRLEVLAARKVKFATSTLDLAKPEAPNGAGEPAKQRDRTAEKAGTVEVITGADAQKFAPAEANK